MPTLNIEVHSRKAISLRTTLNEDVEVIVSDLDTSFYQKGVAVEKGKGYYDTVIATIPKERRALVAQFLLKL